MTPDRSKGRPALEEEIASLEAEMTRVAALSTTSDTDRANLADRLQRLKQKVGMPPQ
jgi:hypothetical protein